jgi:hypothetical protein
MRWCLGLLFCFLLSAVACKKANNGSAIPSISLVGINSNTISQSSEDTIYIIFRVIDGDADIDGDTTGIFLSDVRNDSVYNTYPLDFPDVPAELQDATKGLDAVCTLALNSNYFLMREDDTLRTLDTMKYRFYIQDMALNKSNEISTGDIFITK